MAQGDAAETRAAPTLCVACGLAQQTGSALYHVRCTHGPCECTHDTFRAIQLRGPRTSEEND
jgi:hypothetical protein